MTPMNPIAQRLFDDSAAVRAFLRGAVWVNFAVVDTALEAHPRQHLIDELPQASVKGMLTQHPFRHDAEVEVFDKHHL